MNLGLLLILITGFSATLGYQCENTRIYRGTETTIDRYPFIVSLQVPGLRSDSKWNIVCSGTIIAAKKVLTSGMCVKKLKNHDIGSLRVRSNTEFWDCGCHRARNHTVAGYIIHDDFAEIDVGNGRININDIAIVSVFESFNGIYAKIKSFDESIPFWEKFQSNGVNKGTVVAGWGDTGKKRSTNQLRRTCIHISGYRKCRERYQCEETKNRALYCGLLFNQQMVGPCLYDEGGPHLTKFNGRLILIGVISKATACDKNRNPMNRPSTFTNISQYVEWINIKLADDSNPDAWF